MRDFINGQARRVPTWAVYALGTLPFVWIVWQVLSGGYGPDPVRGIETELGQWGLKFLIASLVVTPLRWGGINLLKFRRAIGLIAFFYILAHLSAWVVLDLAFRWGQIFADLTRRPYIIVGMLGLLAMLPLAITSNDASIRRLGGAAWRRLHMLAYVAGVAGAVHFVMIGKVWNAESLTYLAIVAVLLAARVIRTRLKRAESA